MVHNELQLESSVSPSCPEHVATLDSIDERYLALLETELPGAWDAKGNNNLDRFVGQTISLLFHPLHQTLLHRLAETSSETIRQVAGQWQEQHLVQVFSPAMVEELATTPTDMTIVGMFIERHIPGQGELVKRQISAEIEAAWNESDEIRHVRGSDDPTTFGRRDMLIENARRLRVLLTDFDALEQRDLPIPADSNQRAQLVAFLQQRGQAGRTRMDDEEQYASRASSWSVLSPDSLYPDSALSKHWVIANGCTLPNWGNDPTVTADMLIAADIMVGQLLSLEALSIKLAEQAPLFIGYEVTRAKDTPHEYALLAASAEGLLSIVQSLDIAYGQVIIENPEKDPDQLIQGLCESGIPLAFSRYYPLGTVGPQNLHGTLIRNRVIVDPESGRYVVPENVIDENRVVKADARSAARRIGSVHNSEEYFSEARYLEMGSTLSVSAGNVCPISKEIQELTMAYLRIFQEVRASRQTVASYAVQ